LERQYVVPNRENSEEIFGRDRVPAGPVERVVEPRQERLPHGLDDPSPIVEFFERARLEDGRRASGSIKT
jgi:hypothetical protein